MALKYAPLCSNCNAHRTLNPSGLCSHCRRHVTSPCKICGITHTTHESGFCYRCRRNGAPRCSSLEKAIEVHEHALYVLKMRAENIPFSQIAAEMNLNRTRVYSIYLSALHLPHWAQDNLK